MYIQRITTFTRIRSIIIITRPSANIFINNSEKVLYKSDHTKIPDKKRLSTHIIFLATKFVIRLKILLFFFLNKIIS